MSVPESGKHSFCICSCGCNRMVSRTTVWRHKNRRRSLVQTESTPRPKQRRIAHFQAESPIITHDKQKRSRTNNISSTSHSRVDASDHPRISTLQSRAPSVDEFKPSPPLLNPPPASNLPQPPGDAVEADQDLNHLIPAATNTVATLPTPEDVRHAKNTILRARLAVLEHKLKVAEEAARAGGSNTEHAQVECPKKVGNLRAAMSLDPCTYRAFCVDVARFAVVAGLSFETRWPHQDICKFARVCKMARKKYTFLKRYVSDWPIKEYLKQHFTNQRNYNRRVQRARDASAALGKNKG